MALDCTCSFSESASALMTQHLDLLAVAPALYCCRSLVDQRRGSADLVGDDDVLILVRVAHHEALPGGARDDPDAHV
eukprot:3936296-Rhodomonas_salina.1